MRSFYGLVAGVSLHSLLVASTGPVVDVGYARYEGVTDASLGVTTWFGIRYAQNPTGQLRFQAPQPIEAKNDYSATQVMDATKSGPICVQGDPAWITALQGKIPSNPRGTEDCLLLNVLVPAKPVASFLPVMVQIHGGGYTILDASLAPGYALVNQSHGNLIYVAIQYRLGVFGFLSSAEVRDNGAANAGLLDMRAALNWVQRNIRRFGGDPGQVTIIGGSAGGGAVMNQMILYGGEATPPFRAVIAEYPWWQPYHNNTVLEDQYRELLTSTNCSNLACLRSVPASTLLPASQATYFQGYNAMPEMYYGYGDFYYGPSVDGNVIRDLPSNEFKQGHFSKVPLLVNRDGYEGAIFTNQSETTVLQETADLQALFPSAKQSFFTRLYELYPRDHYNSTFFQRQTLFGDFIINCPTYYMATAVSDWGQSVYKLVFSAGSELHGATSPFLFSTNLTVNGVNPPSLNSTLALIMKDWYLSFAIHLNPNTVAYSNAKKPYWPSYQAAGVQNLTVMDVNYTMIGRVDDRYFDATVQCDFFHGQSYVVRN